MSNKDFVYATKERIGNPENYHKQLSGTERE